MPPHCGVFRGDIIFDQWPSPFCQKKKSCMLNSMPSENTNAWNISYCWILFYFILFYFINGNHIYNVYIRYHKTVKTELLMQNLETGNARRFIDQHGFGQVMGATVEITANDHWTQYVFIQGWVYHVCMYLYCLDPLFWVGDATAVPIHSSLFVVPFRLFSRRTSVLQCSLTSPDVMIFL